MTTSSPEFAVIWDAYADQFDVLAEKLEAAGIPVIELSELCEAKAKLQKALFMCQDYWFLRYCPKKLRSTMPYKAPDFNPEG